MTEVRFLFDGTGEKGIFKFESKYIQNYCKANSITASMVKQRLIVGDYTISGFENVMAIERKKLDDFTGRLGKPGPKAKASAEASGKEARDKRAEFFDRQVKPLAAMQYKAILIEADWNDITFENYNSAIHPNSVKGTVATIISMGVPVIFCSSSAGAEELTFMLLMRWFQNLKSPGISTTYVGGESE